MPAGQPPSYQANETSADPFSMAEPLARPRTMETGASARARGPHRWLLPTLLMIVVVAIAFNSLRATGAEYPRTRSSQAANGVTRQAPNTRRGFEVPARSATTALGSTGASSHAVAGARMSPTAEQVALPSPPRPLSQPNEVGQILILEYHVFTTDPAQVGRWVRTIDAFRSDLEWLYAHDFAVVPLRDVFLNRISAPRGKHPVVLTFDDGTAGQFRFLPQPDGTLRVDPNSAVGVLEEMFALHPDFGRGGHFAVLPFNCFHVPEEPDQEPYCQAKLRWLDAHGYEVGNHTTGHTDLRDVADDTFKSTIGDAIAWARASAPGSSPDILTLPFGNYPDAKQHPDQVRWLHDGFTYDGRHVKLLGALMVGGGLAPSPVSVLWNSVKVPRIQVADTVLTYWQAYCEAHEDLLYTSDGNSATITVLRDQPPQLQGAFDPARAAGKRVVVE
jgi:peptidoglycan/xylan/chitin deacetylase (PgdA/CDA1 family)